MRTSAIAAVALAVGVALTGCSGSEPDGPAATSTSGVVPEGFDLPAGVTLSKGGSTVKVGAPATVLYEPGDLTTSAVTVTVSAIEPGSMDDFTFFSLDEATKKSSPFYVKVNVLNNGPAGLGGAALPLFVRDSANTNLPASDIVGTFKKCQTSTLPATFLPGAVADVCLVYLVPEGHTLEAVSLQTGTPDEAITWRP